MRIYAGTSGFSYKEWKGAFYPQKLPAKSMLAYYAGRLPAVEINNTFYRLPKRETLVEWSRQVPETFRFAIKASRRITHIKRLKDCEAETEYLFGVLGELGARLGSVLFQLPPYLKVDRPRLARFLELLPAGPRVAIEFRNQSWYDDDVLQMLGDRNIAVVVTETDEAGPSPHWTADWTYLRLRKSVYSDQELQGWRERLLDRSLVEAQAFFKHEDEAAGPVMASRFLELFR